mgnify:CR=1 FL=1
MPTTTAAASSVTSNTITADRWFVQDGFRNATPASSMADIGIAFDGDGDRLIMVDHKGEEVDGDELVAIIAASWKKAGYLKSNTVVGTKMTNLGIRKALAEQDIKFIEANVGDRYVMEKLIQTK